MVTISEGKHYSLGLELELVTSSSGAQLAQYMFDVQKLYCRLLTFPLVTVAAANGIAGTPSSPPYYSSLLLMYQSRSHLCSGSSHGPLS